MSSFQKKDIESDQTIGDKLKKKRIEQGFDISTIAKQINVASDYLEFIESGDFDKLPGDVYFKNFLRSYCDFLRLDYQEILQCYEDEKGVRQRMKNVSLSAFDKKEKDKSSRWYSFITLNLFKNLILVSLVIASLFFLGTKINNIVSAPDLIIMMPEPNLITKANSIDIVGQTDIGAKVSINGQSVLIDSDGTFSERVDLQFGLNVVKIVADKKYGKSVEVYRDVMVER